MCYFLACLVEVTDFVGNEDGIKTIWAIYGHTPKGTHTRKNMDINIDMCGSFTKVGFLSPPKNKVVLFQQISP